MATQPQPLTPRTLEEFRRRRRLLDDLRFDEARARLSGFLDWIESEPSVKEIVETIERSVPAANLLEGTNQFNPPNTRTPEDVASVGFYLIRKVVAGEELWKQSYIYGVRPRYSTNNVQDMASEVLNRYIYPAIDHIESELEARVTQELSQEWPEPGISEAREPAKIGAPGGMYVHPARIAPWPTATIRRVRSMTNTSMCRYEKAKSSRLVRK
jgi:hypothetical protein